MGLICPYPSHLQPLSSPPGGRTPVVFYDPSPVSTDGQDLFDVMSPTCPKPVRSLSLLVSTGFMSFGSASALNPVETKEKDLTYTWLLKMVFLSSPMYKGIVSPLCFISTSV